MALPETLSREEVCVLLGVTIDQLDACVAQHFGDFRSDGSMSLKTARQIADQIALQNLRDTLASPCHPRQHEGHDVVVTDMGVWCRECRASLFDWPQSVDLALRMNPSFDAAEKGRKLLERRARQAGVAELDLDASGIVKPSGPPTDAPTLA